MKTANDVIRGKIVSYDERTGELMIRAYYDDYYTMSKRGYKACNIQLIDSRQLSDKQRRTCYALLRDISEYTGMGMEPTKEYMKIKFLSEELQDTANVIFSLSNAPMSLVCAFQKFLVHFMLDFDIPSSMRLIEFVDDVSDFIYACLAAKKCCICGKPADLHHVDHVGMGCDRDEIIHEGMEVLPLCREHHTEVHTIGQQSFNEKYHLDGGIPLDRKLCRIYGLKTRKAGNRYVEQMDGNGASGGGPGAQENGE